MPLNCTVAFSDGAVNFAGQVTGQATDGFTMTTTMYDQLGRVVGVTNSLGETIVLSPERGELSTITDPGGHTTTFSYDAAGSVAQVSDSMGNTTRYAYDASERATTVTDPLGHTTSYGYDADGRMITSVDAGGATTTNTYDSAGRLAGQSAPGDTTMYMYDSSGRLTEVSDNDGHTTTYSYDAMNRLISETMTPPSGGLTTTADGDTTNYTYDAPGNLISVTDPDDNMTKFTYDAFGDLISMTDPKFGATTFAYFAVPEPSTWAAMLLGFAGLAFAGRLRARKTSFGQSGRLATASRQSSLPASAALSLSAASWALRQCGAMARARS
ncbi:MAG TPA: PEP-CTERM sorting domain-containing protein [Roseiarcus sp.]|jgi:YD repeat-containing protein|nr:PEP-CTERM sorting domain-containing protein [Roseiarcus sp.]